jgi:hypothetical protein
MQAYDIKASKITSKTTKLMTRQHLLLSTLWLTACSPTTTGNGAAKAEDSGEESVIDCEADAKSTFWEDLDGDGFGNPDRPDALCGAEDGWVDNSEDCDDASGEISPSQEERCDGVDNNCDGLVDDDASIDASNWFRDSDGDGFGAGPPRGFGCSGLSDEVNNNGDCDDEDGETNPDAVEVCDGVDNDCDGGTDNGETPDGYAVYEDIDADGWGHESSELIRCVTPEGWSDRGGDCDDEDEDKNPDAVDECDGSDMDCDGHIDSHCNSVVAAEDGWSLSLGEGSIIASMHISDMNGDGTNDLLAFDIANSEALFFAGPISSGELDPDLTIEFSAPSDDPDTATHMAFGSALEGDVDFNGDGHPDLLISAAETNLVSGEVINSVGLFLGPDWLDLDSRDPDAALTSSSVSTTWGARGLPSGDLTGDGQPDVVITSGESSLVIWGNPLEDVMLDDLTILHTPGRTENMIPAVHDVNGDGQADLIVSTGDTLAIRHGPISTSTLATVPDLTLSAPLHAVVGDGLCAADLTGDGAIDLAYTEAFVPGTDGEVDKVHVMDLSSDEINPSWTTELPTSGEIIVLRCDDIDGDGRADLLVNDYFNSDSHILGGMISLFFGTLDSGVVAPDHRFEGTRVEGAIGLGSASGDLSGDGIGDLVLSGFGATYLHTGDAWVSDEWLAAE